MAGNRGQATYEQASQLDGDCDPLAAAPPGKFGFKSAPLVGFERATILDLRRRAVRRLLGQATKSGDFRAAGPYRRSASVHDITERQYIPENALAAVLLAIGGLCELHEELLAPELAVAWRHEMCLPAGPEAPARPRAALRYPSERGRSRDSR
jgi:hypothetical protein